MENLFIEPIEHEKYAMVRVSDDTTKWVKEIIGELLKNFPELANTPLQVSYHQKDPAKGFAVASIQADGFSVPAVISDFTLSPLDVVIVNSIMLPLTKETLYDLMQNPNAFSTVVKGRKELATTVFDSPLSLPSDNYGSNSFQSFSNNFIDKISSFVERKDYERLIDEITKPEHYAGFVKNDTTDVVEKISSLKVSDVVDFAEASLSNINIDRQMIFEDELGNKHVKQANSKVDYTWTTPLGQLDAVSNKCATYSEENIENKEVSSGNTYPIEEGILYLTKEGEFYIFDRESHVKIAEKVNNFEVEGNMPELGDHGIFVVGNEATSPFEVVGLQKVAGAGNFEVTGWDGLTKTAYLPLRGIDKDSLIPHEDLDNTYYVPGNGKFVKLAGELKVTFSEIDNELDKNYVERDEIGLYSISGPGFNKYGQIHNLRNLSKDEATWIAVHCGAAEKDLDKISKLVPNSHVKLAGKIKSPISTSELERILESEYEKCIVDIPTLTTLLVKEASTLADKNSVDAILSLGLLNKRNVMEYLTLLPEYEQVLSELAKLLVAARIGLPNVVDIDVKEAMEAFAKVVYALKGLNSMLESA